VFCHGVVLISVVRLQVTISTPPITLGAKDPPDLTRLHDCCLMSRPLARRTNQRARSNSVHFLTDFIDQSKGRNDAKVLDRAGVDRLCSLSIRPCSEAQHRSRLITSISHRLRRLG
jgi:hypothetical protein